MHKLHEKIIKFDNHVGGDPSASLCQDCFSFNEQIMMMMVVMTMTITPMMMMMMTRQWRRLKRRRRWWWQHVDFSYSISITRFTWIQLFKFGTKQMNYNHTFKKSSQRTTYDGAVLYLYCTHDDTCTISSGRFSVRNLMFYISSLPCTPRCLKQITISVDNANTNSAMC